MQFNKTDSAGTTVLGLESKAIRRTCSNITVCPFIIRIIRNSKLLHYDTKRFYIDVKKVWCSH